MNARYRLTLSVVLFGLTGCAAEAARGTSSASPVPSFKDVRVVDMTHPFDDKTLYWPTAKTGFVRETVSYGKTPGGYFYSAYSFCAPEHGGTHLDAPIHFAEGKSTADVIPLARLMAPAVVVVTPVTGTAVPTVVLARVLAGVSNGLLVLTPRKLVMTAFHFTAVDSVQV